MSTYTRQELTVLVQKLIACKEDIEQALIAKGQTITVNTPFSDFGDLVRDIPGTDTSDATAVAGDILQGVTAYARGSKLVGTATPGESLYICTGVTPELSKWQGYRLVRDSAGTAFVYANTLTTGLSYSVMIPEPGSIYTTDATAKIAYVYRPYTFTIDYTVPSRPVVSNLFEITL